MLHITLIAIVLAAPFSLMGQNFGKNKVQYRTFDWSYIQSAHFDIYFYGENLQLAEFTSEVSEKAYDQIGRAHV